MFFSEYNVAVVYFELRIVEKGGKFEIEAWAAICSITLDILLNSTH